MSKDLFQALSQSLATRSLNIFAPPNQDYWHVFTWGGKAIAANLYVCFQTTETLVDLYPLVAGAANMDFPLAEGQRVADWIPLLPAGHA